MPKIWVGLTVVWWTLIWAMMYEEFVAESEMYYDRKVRRIAIWLAFIVYPAVMPLFLIWAVILGSIRTISNVVDSILKIGRGKYSGKASLTQEKRHGGKRRHGRKEFNHWGRD